MLDEMLGWFAGVLIQKINHSVNICIVRSDIYLFFWKTEWNIYFQSEMVWLRWNSIVQKHYALKTLTLY